MSRRHASCFKFTPNSLEKNFQSNPNPMFLFTHLSERSHVLIGNKRLGAKDIKTNRLRQTTCPS